MSSLKLFGKWETEGISVTDPGLKNYVNLKPIIIPRTFGRASSKQFHRSQMNIVERLVNHIYVSGHRGKKHTITSGKNVGKTFAAWKIIQDTFKIIEERTKKNPVEVLVKALENAAIREEITSFQVGGIIVRKAVITSPQRRIDLALRLIVQGSYQKSFNNIKKMSDSLADEIFAAYNNDSQNSFSVKERERKEREAGGAR
ncbi:30S ribosomal protein S7 [Candidatus Micrarchaeota archaeon RBG_16_36_9]|nr:MAG: 30S ribosomal protein S7 [Candidatus Micrarchaeota archaeon RBG_16_36_9]